MHKEIFQSTKLNNDITIALLSDIHYYKGYNPKILNKIILQIEKTKPNYICIPGDIVDRSGINNIDCKTLFNWLEEIAKTAPVLISLGNHDIKDGGRRKWKYNCNPEYINGLKKLKNVYLLEENTKEFDNISFYGFNLSYDYYETDDEKYETFEKEVKDLNPNFNKKDYNVILFHSPINIYKFIKNNKNHPFNYCDLILSGHMHNGCLPYWFSHLINKLFKTSRSIISPLRTIFPKYSHGKIYNDIKDGFVYEGLNKLSKCTRKLHKFDFIYSKNIQLLTIKKSTKN
jgi:predicted MPP superfamily phosphohydrolase